VLSFNCQPGRIDHGEFKRQSFEKVRSEIAILRLEPELVQGMYISESMIDIVEILRANLSLRPQRDNRKCSQSIALTSDNRK